MLYLWAKKATSVQQSENSAFMTKHAQTGGSTDDDLLRWHTKFMKLQCLVQACCSQERDLSLCLRLNQNRQPSSFLLSLRNYWTDNGMEGILRVENWGVMRKVWTMATYDEPALGCLWKKVFADNFSQTYCTDKLALVLNSSIIHLSAWSFALNTHLYL